MRQTDAIEARGPRLAAGWALLAALLVLALAAAPDPAAAQTVCVPNGDGTYTPVDGGAEGPGSVVIGPGESCPAAEPEPVAAPVGLPAEPECPACPEDEDDEKKARSATGSSGDSGYTGGAPVSDTSVGAAPERLPFTGSDDIRFALLLGGVGLIALGFGWALRRRTSQEW